MLIDQESRYLRNNFPNTLMGGGVDTRINILKCKREFDRLLKPIVEWVSKKLNNILKENVMFEIKQICPRGGWDTIKDRVRKLNNEELKALRIVLLGGIKPVDSLELLKCVIDFSKNSVHSYEDAALKIIKVINRFK